MPVKNQSLLYNHVLFSNENIIGKIMQQDNISHLKPVFMLATLPSKKWQNIKNVTELVHLKMSFVHLH